MPYIEELTDKVERLLQRHEELLRTKTLLEQQVMTLLQERDQLRARLNTARSRIDDLIERCPPSTETSPL
jgi:cell division protein ZapB